MIEGLEINGKAAHELGLPIHIHIKRNGEIKGAWVWRFSGDDAFIHLIWSEGSDNIEIDMISQLGGGGRRKCIWNFTDGGSLDAIEFYNSKSSGVIKRFVGESKNTFLLYYPENNSLAIRLGDDREPIVIQNNQLQKENNYG